MVDQGPERGQWHALLRGLDGCASSQLLVVTTTGPVLRVALVLYKGSWNKGIEGTRGGKGASYGGALDRLYLLIAVGQ